MAHAKPTVIDVFCGIGGLSYAFLKEGFKVAAGIDLDESCRYAFEANVDAPFLHEDVADLSGSRLRSLFVGAGRRVLIGCAPCQPFSLYTKRRRSDRQWRLLSTFAKLVRLSKPDVVTMENVPRLVKHRVFREFVVALKDAGYHVTFSFACAHRYGVPQRRTRLVLLASRHGDIRLLPPTHDGHIRTVRDAIGHLPPIPAGGRARTDRLHTARGLSNRNLKRLRATPAGGAWADWDRGLRLKCHKKKTGVSFRSVYGRMRWDQPSPVITTQCLGIGNGRFGHPEQDRAISIREAATLQTFPKEFRFVEPRGDVLGEPIARHIGNAVPIRLGRIIARSIARHLDEVDGRRGAAGMRRS